MSTVLSILKRNLAYGWLCWKPYFREHKGKAVVELLLFVGTIPIFLAVVAFEWLCEKIAGGGQV